MHRSIRIAALVLLAAAGSAAAQTYPAHSVKWVVPYPPGGTTDLLARIVAQWLADKLGQPFLIENKPGGGNNIGVDYVVEVRAGRLHDAAGESRRTASTPRCTRTCRSISSPTSRRWRASCARRT